MNFYYEIAQGLVDRGDFDHRYYVEHNIEIHRSPVMGHGLFSYDHAKMTCSNRAWREDNNGKVTWQKNRFEDIDSPVDLQEFIWIKLKCQSI